MGKKVEYIKCICLTCGKEFDVAPCHFNSGRGKYCSRNCSDHRIGANPSDKRITINCEICGSAFLVKEYRKDTAKYCSQKCYRLGRRSGKKICVYCGEEYEGSKAARGGVSSPGKKYCSRKCRDDAKKTSLDIVCVVCGKSFLARKYREKEVRCCSRACAVEDRVKRIALGDLKNSYTYGKHGSYVSQVSGVKERFDSSWEQIRMVQLDRLGYSWTKKHGIVIPYCDEKGKKRRYIPDFLVSDGSNTWIEEVKPQFKVNEPEIIAKRIVGESFCLSKSWGYRMITEKELGLVVKKQIDDVKDGNVGEQLSLF